LPEAFGAGLQLRAHEIACALPFKEGPLWTVKVGQLGTPTEHFPPPQTRTVTTARFAGDFVPV
jgi:hypothetical protein